MKCTEFKDRQILKNECVQNCVSSVLFLKFYPEFFLLEITIWSIYIPKTSSLQASDVDLQIKQEGVSAITAAHLSQQRIYTSATLPAVPGNGGASCILYVDMKAQNISWTM